MAAPDTPTRARTASSICKAKTRAQATGRSATRPRCSRQDRNAQPAAITHRIHGTETRSSRSWAWRPSTATSPRCSVPRVNSAQAPASGRGSPPSTARPAGPPSAGRAATVELAPAWVDRIRAALRSPLRGQAPNTAVAGVSRRATITPGSAAARRTDRRSTSRPLRPGSSAGRPKSRASSSTTRVARPGGRSAVRPGLTGSTRPPALAIRASGLVTTACQRAPPRPRPSPPSW